MVLLTHLFPSVVTILLGLCLNLFGRGNSVIPLFLAGYALFSMGIGMLLPVWQNYLVTIFSPATSVSALSVMMIAQSAAKLASSLMIREFVHRYGFAVSPSSVFFIITGTFFFLGSLCFLFTHERDSGVEEGTSTRRTVTETLGTVFRNRNFLLFLGNEMEMNAVTGIMAFYATYAAGFHGVAPETAAGIFVALNYTGAIIINILLGWFGWLSIKNKCILSKGFSLGAVAILLVGRSTAAFLVVSFLLGSARAVRWLIYAPAIKQISGESDATVFFSVAPILTLPFSLGIPLAGGKLLDSLSARGAGSYRIVFCLMALFIVIALVSNLLTDFNSVAEYGDGGGDREWRRRVRRRGRPRQSA